MKRSRRQTISLPLLNRESHSQLGVVLIPELADIPKPDLKLPDPRPRRPPTLRDLLVGNYGCERIIKVLQEP